MLSDTMMLGGGRKAAYPMENSLLFRGAQYLSRTPSEAGNRKTFTISLWFRVCKLGVNRTLFAQGAGTQGGGWCVYLRYDDTLSIYDGTQDTRTARKFRDVTAWYHLVVSVDTREETAKDRYKMYINGVPETSFLQETYPSRYEELLFNQMGVVHRISGDTDATLFNGYLAEPLFVDGQALPPTTFGEVDTVTGSWRPKTLAGITWGPNGFHLGKPWDSASLDTDASGNGNHWTPSGFVASDVVADNPTNVYATLNPLSAGSLVTLSEGNLKRKAAGQAVDTGYGMYTYATLPIPDSDVWQMEVRIDTSVANGKGGIGVAVPAPVNKHATAYLSYYPDIGTIVDENGTVAAVANATLNDHIQVVADTTAGVVVWYKNGVLLHSHTRNVAGWFFNVRPYASNVVEEHSVNFGQRAFSYTPVANVRSLCTATLPLSAHLPAGTFIGNANADGPCVYTGAVPLTLSVNGNAVTWGTHADKLATGFKIRTASTSYNSTGTNTWTATYASPQKPTVGPKGRAPANAQANP